MHIMKFIILLDFVYLSEYILQKQTVNCQFNHIVSVNCIKRLTMEKHRM